MRYFPNENLYLAGRLPTGETVTIEVYSLHDGATVPLNSNACTEIAATGIYRWAKSNITTPPTSYTEYVYTMIDSLNNRYDGKFVIHTGADQAAAVWASAIEGGLTAEEIQRVILAAVAGKRQGLGTATEQYMSQDNLKARITLTGFDSNGNGDPAIDGSP